MAAHPGSCDTDTTAANVTRAEKREPFRNYAFVSVVILNKKQTAGQWTIEFGVYGMTNTFVANWGDEADMWAACPSSLPSLAETDDNGTNAGTPPDAGARGELLLSEEYVNANSITATPKWPRAEADVSGPYATMKVFPLRLTLEGIELNDNRHIQATFELLDPDIAARGQKLVLNEEPMDLQFGLKGFAKVGVKFPETAASVKRALDVLHTHGKHAGREVAKAWEVIARGGAYVATASKDDREAQAIAKLLAPFLER